MTKKKDNGTSLSVEEQARIAQIQEKLPQIATQLHQSAGKDEIEAALTEINALTEATQLALLKEIARNQTTDAADVALALNEFSPNKTVRKEARRSLLRLQAEKIQPEWQPPQVQAPLLQFPDNNPPRFWKGYVTQAREEGEVQLILTWEQGYEYNEVRMMVFLLDFWEQGVKDFFVDITNKRNVDTQIQHMRARLADITIAECTLAEGRRLIEEALQVNAWKKTTPHKDYRQYLPTIKQLILDADVEDSADRGLTFINPNIEADEVAATFVGGWALGDFGLTYDMLSQDSSLKEGQTREEWIQLHHQWADEAHPTRFELSFVREREQSNSGLWLPTSITTARSNSRKEIEVAWSLEISDTPLSGALKEMPMGTAVYKETGRHWFWTRYSMVQENGGWRIAQITDEGAAAQGLSIEELQQRLKDGDERVQKIMQESNPQSEGSQKALEEVAILMTKGLYYDDALIVKLPLDRTYYEDGYSRATALGFVERSLVYLEKLANRFPENKAAVLREMGLLEESLSTGYYDVNMNERGNHFAELAEKTLLESLELENNIGGHAMLAEILLRRGERLNVAEEHLQQARALATTTKEEAMVESDLGDLEVEREQPAAALPHYIRASELDPTLPNIWFKIGFMYRNLGQYEDAKATYERAMEQQPDDIRSYSEMTAIYMNEQKYTQAREVLERGLRSNPHSAHLLALLSSVYLQTGQRRHAEEVLAQAEKINPTLEIVQTMREQLSKQKKK